MNDKELADAVTFLDELAQRPDQKSRVQYAAKFIAALRRGPERQPEGEMVKEHMRIEDDLQGRIVALEEMLSMACAVAEAGFDTDYGFNYEASLEPRRIITKIREALKSRA